MEGGKGAGKKGGTKVGCNGDWSYDCKKILNLLSFA